MTESKPIRVMTVDDHEIMRGGINFLLLAFEDIELVAEARNGEEAIRLCGEVLPDVVLMDFKMPKMDGVTTTKSIKDLYPQVQVLMLTSFHDKELVQRAIGAGAIGYVLKDASKEELARAIRDVCDGRTTLSRAVAMDLVKANEPPPRGAEDLTDRELQILKLLAKGLTNNQIAERVHRSPFTVRHHVSQIFAKLGVANRAEAAALAVAKRLLGEASPPEKDEC